MSGAVIVGAGAIGGWLANALDQAGWEVSVLARGATLAQLQSHGLAVRQQGHTRVSRLRAGDVAALAPQPYVVLAVKAHWLPSLAASLKPLIGPQTVIVSATNGLPWWFLHDFGGVLANQLLAAVDPQGLQEKVFPRDRILGAVVHAAVRVISPACIEVVAADKLILGAPGGESSAPLSQLSDALRRGGIATVESAHLREDVWIKLWGNMNMNPLSALTRQGTARMLADPEVRALCLKMMGEMQACGQALDLSIPLSAAERMAVTERLGDFRTSMLADLQAGRSLELEPQLGAVVEIAGKLGISAPYMRSILALARLLSSAQPP